MQAAATFRVVFPGLPGREKIQSEAKTGFENDKTILALPALRQIVAAKKDVTGLRRAAVSRVINVVKCRGIRFADGVEGELRGLQFFH